MQKMEGCRKKIGDSQKLLAADRRQSGDKKQAGTCSQAEERRREKLEQRNLPNPLKKEKRKTKVKFSLTVDSKAMT